LNNRPCTVDGSRGPGLPNQYQTKYLATASIMAKSPSRQTAQRDCGLRIADWPLVRELWLVRSRRAGILAPTSTGIPSRGPVDSMERLQLISERMPDNGRAVFVIDPEKYMQANSDQDWAIVVRKVAMNLPLSRRFCRPCRGFGAVVRHVPRLTPVVTFLRPCRGGQIRSSHLPRVSSQAGGIAVLIPLSTRSPGAPGLPRVLQSRLSPCELNHCFCRGPYHSLSARLMFLSTHA
jgi:hypothetical protein